LYRFENGHLEVEEQDQLVMLTDWATKLKDSPKPILFVGNDLPLHQNTIKDILGNQAVFAAITEFNPRPSELAFLGRDKQGEDIHTFVPNYIRLAEAEAKWLEAKGKI
jgi:tRNA threonylcarbamoyladenosine biosynthesis protein TsaB